MKKNWINSPWTIGLTCAIISILGTIITDYIKKIPILTTIENIFSSIFDLLNFIRTLELRLWWILVAVIILAGILYLTSRIKKLIPPQIYAQYREDNFRGWRWTWSWEYDTKKKIWVIAYLQAYCPKCGTTLIYNSVPRDPRYECPRCSFRANWKTQTEINMDHIKVLIYDNILRKT